MKAMILAAGFGSRFQPHTLQVPKPAIPFLNIPMGFHCFHYLKEAGVTSLIVNAHHLPNKIVDLYQSQKKFPVIFSHETNNILGSSGGLKQAEAYFKSETCLFLLNADEVIFSAHLDIFKKLKKQHEEQNNLATLLVMEHPEVGTKFGGVWVDDKNQVLGFGKTKIPGAQKVYHFVGVQCLSSKVFQYIEPNKEQNIFYDTLRLALENKESVSVYPVDCHWFETGNLQDYLSANEEALKILKENPTQSTAMKTLLQEFSPNSDWIASSQALVWGDQSSIIKNCQFRDFAVIGENVLLENVQAQGAIFGKNITLRDSTVSNDLKLLL